jgi:copper homeostasis protein
MPKMLVEICCGSAEDVIESQKAQADRVELNSSLFEGGLTPSIGELLVAKETTNLPILSMVRPRAGGFCYTQTEFQTALKDAESLLANGSDGIVFGFLNADGTIDAERCRKMMDTIGSKESVFHRAIDVVPDWKKAIDTLIGLGVTRILTSGQRPSALDGAGTIAEMIRYANGRIQILPGGGVRQYNVKELLEKTGCRQVHISPHKNYFDTSVSGNPAIHFGGALYPPEDRFSVVDASAVRGFMDEMGGYRGGTHAEN